MDGMYVSAVISMASCNILTASNVCNLTTVHDSVWLEQAYVPKRQNTSQTYWYQLISHVAIGANMADYHSTTPAKTDWVEEPNVLSYTAVIISGANI